MISVIKTMGWFAGLFICLVLLLGCNQSSAPDSASATPSVPAVTVYLVRHAEKVDSSRDPELSDAGKARAIALADRLEGAGLTAIHSSDYIRTRDTAAPIAARLGLTVELYDPRDLPAMAAKLTSTAGTHLVVGHSNTTPQLTILLGGEGGAPIVEASEYDRLYLVKIEADGGVSSDIQRYGEPSE